MDSPAGCRMVIVLIDDMHLIKTRDGCQILKETLPCLQGLVLSLRRRHYPRLGAIQKQLEAFGQR